MGDLAKGRQAGFGNDAWVSEMTDRLSLTRAFEGAGIQSELAEPLTTEIYNAIHESVATKDGVSRRLRLSVGCGVCSPFCEDEWIEVGSTSSIEEGAMRWRILCVLMCR